MTTPRSRANVSIAAMLTVTLALAACGGGPSRLASGDPMSVARLPLVIRFDNDAREHVHIYLITEQRQFLLGRVEPGAKAALRIPDASLASSPRFVQLAVITGQGVTLNAARDPRAKLTVAQPVGDILSQQWSFTQGQLTSLGHTGPRASAGRRSGTVF
jgi:hypothetical protein